MMSDDIGHEECAVFAEKVLLLRSVCSMTCRTPSLTEWWRRTSLKVEVRMGHFDLMLAIFRIRVLVPSLLAVVVKIDASSSQMSLSASEFE